MDKSLAQFITKLYRHFSKPSVVVLVEEERSIKQGKFSEPQSVFSDGIIFSPILFATRQFMNKL